MGFILFLIFFLMMWKWTITHRQQIPPFEPEAQIKEEILEGRYQIVSQKPRIVSALGAIKKSSGKV